MRWAFVFLCLLFGLLPSAVAGAVWIDTDPSIGPPWREVDDAFALVLAFHSPETRVAGISTTYGNASSARTNAVARNLVRRFGAIAGLTERDVHSGARAARDINARTAASHALARTLRQKRVTYVALGPLTNLAAFLYLHPELAGRIERVILVGGRSPGERLTFGPKGSLRIHDANVFKDPAAARQVLVSKIPIVLAPVETSRQLAFNGEDLRAIRAGRAGQYLHARTRVWDWFWTKFVREKGGPLFDVLAILPAVRPDSVVTEERCASFNEGGDLIARRAATCAGRRVKFAVGIRAGTKQFVLERLGRGGGNGL